MHTHLTDNRVSYSQRSDLTGNLGRGEPQDQDARVRHARCVLNPVHKRPYPIGRFFSVNGTYTHAYTAPRPPFFLSSPPQSPFYPPTHIILGARLLYQWHSCHRLHLLFIRLRVHQPAACTLGYIHSSPCTPACSMYSRIRSYTCDGRMTVPAYWLTSSASSASPPPPSPPSATARRTLHWQPPLMHTTAPHPPFFLSSPPQSPFYPPTHIILGARLLYQWHSCHRLHLLFIRLRVHQPAACTLGYVHTHVTGE
jgi:hypothetical protein